jgi:hypothetical protein
MFTITLHDHIEELRAELRGCLNRRERAKIAAELEATTRHSRSRATPPRRTGRLDEGRQPSAIFSMPDGSAGPAPDCVMPRARSAQERALFVACGMTRFGQSCDRSFVYIEARDQINPPQGEKMADYPKAALETVSILGGPYETISGGIR